MKIVTILGARPQFIKAGTVSREIKKHSKIKEIIVHTGQHYDSNMSDVFFDEMQIPKPDYYLGIGGKSHGAMTGQMIEKIEELLLIEQPDWVLVYGDTNSTLAGAIAASKLHIKVAHIEAGLRSFNMRMPEEINRILTDKVSSLLFCPTKVAIKNLANEGQISADKVIFTGDVMQDGAFFYSNSCTRPKCDLPDEYILATIHRAENTDDVDRITNIISALNEISETTPVVLPIHPRTNGILQANNIKFSNNVHLLEPVGYLNMVWLIKNSTLIITDSGGLQKEAFFFNKLCITMRDETEWVELLEMHVNVLAGAEKDRIIKCFSEFNNKSGCRFNQVVYGNGTASNVIVKKLLDYGK